MVNLEDVVYSAKRSKKETPPAEFRRIKKKVAKPSKNIKDSEYILPPKGTSLYSQEDERRADPKK